MSIISRPEDDHKVAISTRDNRIWKKLRGTTILSAVNAYLSSLRNDDTWKNYQSAFKIFFEVGMLDPNQNLQFLSLANVDSIGDNIRRKIVGCEGTKQARVAAFIGFTSYIERATQGMIRKMRPCQSAGNETFRRLRTKSATDALSSDQCKEFLHYLSGRDTRMALVAKMLLQGSKRVSEVLNARIEDINWEKGTILFKQKKSKIDDCTVITFPQNYMRDLKIYLGSRDGGLIFVSRNGRKIDSSYVYKVFVGASVELDLPVKVTPHVLRASAITILSQKGVSSDQIMRVSGHASPAQVVYYDKTDREENVSREYNLI